jgi:hypothetical protein
MIPDLREALRRYLLPRRHTALLVAIVLAFAVRPLIGDVGASPIAFSFALMVLMLIALYAVQVDEMVAGGGSLEGAAKSRRVIGRVGWTLAAVAVVERIAILVTPTHRFVIVGTICWFAFFAYVTWAELRSVLHQRDVTGETISLSISVYLLFGITWGIFYSLLFQLDPTAFNLGPSERPGLAHNLPHLFPIFVYFSLTTLATVGYGDITPLTLQARYASVAEGITGQLYLAILVARLVGMHMSRLTNPAPRDEPPERRG